MISLDTTDTLAEYTFGASLVAFILLWVVFSLTTAIIVLFLIFSLGAYYSTTDDLFVFLAVLAVSFLTIVYAIN